MAERIQVALGARSYEIMVGERLLAEAGHALAPLLKTKRVIIITDETVARLYLHRLSNALEEQDITARPIVLPAGEATKNFAQLQALVESILEQKPDRNTAVVALGGGVIGDIAGFAASICLRGLPFIQIPTTLLSQVDSSVGGKTAVNSSFGKNLVGTFYQPKLVLADVSLLATLPPREKRSGYAEVLKYGLIRQPEFFAWLEANGAPMLSGSVPALIHAVAESCRAKAAIVSADEHEAGQRALLNFGHTFGHALELETGYSDVLTHGEAVAIGMVMAFRLSVAQGLCKPAELERVLSHYKAAGLPDSPLAIQTQWNVDALMQHFTRDKKASASGLTFILTRGIGQAFVAKDVDADAVRRTVAESCTPAQDQAHG